MNCLSDPLGLWTQISPRVCEVFLFIVQQVKIMSEHTMMSTNTSD